MQAERFLEPYPDQMSPQDIHRGPHAGYIREAQDYSYKWGRVLHALLRDEDGDKSGLEEMDLYAYNDWLHNDFDEFHSDLTDVSVDVRARALNETNFHYLNLCLWGMWSALAEKRWKSSAERAETLNGAEFGFAFRGLSLYAQREAFVQEAGGTHALFEPENKAIHDALTGMVQEYDAAIVLIDFIRRHQNLTLLPAPLQFERTHKPTNVDFVVVDFVEPRAVGVQVKSKLRQADVAVADPDRVVFIDGDADLGNVRVVRTQRARSTERVVAWPGIVAAKKMDRFKAHGPETRQFSTNPSLNQLIAQAPHVLLRQKLLARKLVGNLKVYNDEVSSVIGERILQKL